MHARQVIEKKKRSGRKMPHQPSDDCQTEGVTLGYPSYGNFWKNSNALSVLTSWAVISLGEIKLAQKRYGVKSFLAS